MKNCQTNHAPGDADLLIAQKAVEFTATSNTVLSIDDTDLLMLLIYNANLESHNIFFKHEPTKSTKNIRTMKQKLESSVYAHILFRNTTSSPYGIGKGAALEIFAASDHFLEQASVFHTQSASAADVVAARENAYIFRCRSGREL